MKPDTKNIQTRYGGTFQHTQAAADVRALCNYLETLETALRSINVGLHSLDECREIARAALEGADS